MRMNHHATLTQPTRPARSARQRGSAVILVIVSLVLMMLIGAAYLQSARVQRFATIQPRGDLDSQIQAILGQIQQTLRNDVRDETPDYYMELYDYPWSNQDTADPDNEWTVTLYDGVTTATAYGGKYDDTWLAAQQPDFSANEWPHLTNLNGIYLRYDRASNEFWDSTGALAGTGGDIEQYVTDYSDADHSNSDLAINAAQLVDADGDDIPDSRWTWAPLRTINGIDYVMAVRIVDMSGMVNANMALSQVDDSRVFDTTNNAAPRWDTPAELDLGGFVHDTSESTMASTHMAELQDLLEHRYNAPTSVTAPLPLPWSIDDPFDRLAFWQEQGQYNTEINSAISPPYQRYALSDEYELRRRNGLNKDISQGGNTTTFETADTGMREFVRGAAAEATWEDVDLDTYQYLDGTQGPASGDAAHNEQAYFELEPRHQMTTLSGAAMFAMSGTPGNFNDADLTNNGLKINLNEAPEDVDDRNAMADRLEALFSSAPASPTYVLPGGYDAADPDQLQQFANQMVANVKDYADTDNTPSHYNHDGQEVYGLEALPTVTEVYAQAQYTIEDDSDFNSGDFNSNGTTDYDGTWNRVGNAGYAIEIRNPFRKPIPLENVTLSIIVDPAGTATVDGNWNNEVLSTLASTATPALPTVDHDDDASTPEVPALEPQSVLVLYRHSNDGGTGTPGDPAQDAVANHADGLVEEDASNFDYYYVPMSRPWPSDSTQDGSFTLSNTELGGFSGEDVRLALRINASNGITLTYSAADSLSAPASFRQRYLDPPDTPVPSSAYWQRGAVGNGDRVNALLVPHDQYATPENPDAPQATDGGGTRNRQADFDKLGLDDKTQDTADSPALASGSAPASPVAADQNQLIIRDGAFSHVGELAHLALLRPTDTETVAEVFDSGPSTLEGYMFDFTPNDAVHIDNTADNYNVTYGAFLIDQFTTYSPRVDGVSDGREHLVPGLVNLNTMPEHVLRKVLPIPDTASVDWGSDGTPRTMREEVVWRIVTYREADAVTREGLSFTPSTGDPNDYRDNPGIAYAGELYMLFDDLLNTGDDVHDVNGVPIDFLANPDDTTGDGIMDDREEIAMLAKWLSQVGSTRSDYFAAYVVLRGYDGFKKPDGSSKPAIEAARFIAIFERSARDGHVAVRRVLPDNGIEPYMVK